MKRDGLSVRQTEALIKRMQEEKQEKPPRKKSSEFKTAEKELGIYTKPRFLFRAARQRGKITLEYYSKEQLYALYDMLKKDNKKLPII